jgi:enolase-phosphatase E1
MTQNPQCLLANISHLLLDIEGTTCPVSFVAETLFPYAREHLEPFLRERRHDPEVRGLVTDVISQWRQDHDPRAPQLDPDLTSGDEEHEDDPLRVVPYLKWLISIDRKLTALKDLQGMIWKQGYENQELHGPLFNDVPAALQGLHQQGLVLAVYSSGSVQAQQLLYGHSTAGNLLSLFKHWFDTRIGSKQDPSSYQRISVAMATQPETILFISDVQSELDAASHAGLTVLFSQRPGNPQQDPGPYPSITSFDTLIHGY